MHPLTLERFNSCIDYQRNGRNRMLTSSTKGVDSNNQRHLTAYARAIM